MKKNYDFSKGVRGAHRDQTFTVIGPVKSDSPELDSKATPQKKINLKTGKRVEKSSDKKAVV